MQREYPVLIVERCAPYGFLSDKGGDSVGEKLDRLLSLQETQAAEADWKNKVWFTRSEAAAYLSCSAKTIDRCRIKQDLPFYQVEGTSSIRFKRQYLDRLLN